MPVINTPALSDLKHPLASVTVTPYIPCGMLEMTDDVDWFDFVVVEQIELYDDQEMTEQQNA